MLFELGELELWPTEPEPVFDFSEGAMTGHADGVITLDLREVDDVHRTRMRDQLHEPYRTVLGHFRHEIGHFYQPSLMAGREDEVRALFGDERADYQAALDRHYAEGAPEDWEQSFVSAYATMHPWEDWAETFAHFLHIRDLMQTAAAWRLGVSLDFLRGSEIDFVDDLIGQSFKIHNPNATASCGCGTSFSV